MSNLRPTFHESWYRVAGLRAKLRPSAQISRQHYRGERWYVVRDPAGNQYHRLSSAAYRFVGLLDGSRTVSEAWDLAGGMLADDAPTQPEVVQILTQLHAANLLEANVTPDAAVLLRRHKQMQKRQIQGRLMNILFPRIPLWDLDKFLVRWMPVMRIFLSKFGTVLWLAVIGAACFMLAPRWTDLKNGASNAIDPSNWPMLWATFVIIKLIHELGHAFTCRRFGGEVHELGIMFLVFVPAPYVDASSAWGLPSKWQRILVGAGGMVFELFVAAICAFVWLNTSPNSDINKLAYNTMLIASVSTVIFNANPLLRYDGYYMLSDWLEIPNLKQKSTEYTMGLIKRHVFRVKSPQPLPPIGQRFWLFIYAITSGAYRVFVGIMIILVVSNQVPVLGILMAIGGVITWLFVPIFKISKYLLLDPELHRKRTRAIAFTVAVAGAITVLIGIINFPVRFEATGIAEPLQKETLRAWSDGFVEQVLVTDGQWVTAGQPLVVCRNQRLQSEIVQLENETRAIEQDMAQALVQDPVKLPVHKARLDFNLKNLSERRERQENLTIRAKFDGQVVAPLINQLKGRFLRRGEDVAMIMQSDPLVIKATLDQSEAALLFMNESMWMPLKNLPEQWNSSLVGVERFLREQNLAFTAFPPESQRKADEPPRSIVVEKTSLLFETPAKLTFEFDNSRLTKLVATFVPGSGKTFDDLVALHNTNLNPDRKPPGPPRANQRQAAWMVEHDRAALEVEMTETAGVTTLQYQILGRKAEIRLAGAVTQTLQGRVVSRSPAAMNQLPHASLTFAGGGSHPNDPKDQSGRVTTTPQFQVILKIDNPQTSPGQHRFMPGQRAYVRFTMEKDRPLIWQWWRKLMQLLQTQNAQNKWL